MRLRLISRQSAMSPTGFSDPHRDVSGCEVAADQPLARDVPDRLFGLASPGFFGESTVNGSANKATDRSRVRLDGDRYDSENCSECSDKRVGQVREVEVCTRLASADSCRSNVSPVVSEPAILGVDLPVIIA